MKDAAGVTRLTMGMDEAGVFRFAAADKTGDVRLSMDSNGNLTLTGALATGYSGSPRVTVDGAGIRSYAAGGQLNGLYVDPSDSTGALRLYCNGVNSFTANYAVVGGNSMLGLFANGSPMLQNLNGESVMNGMWQYCNSRTPGAQSEVATQRNVDNLQSYLEGLVGDLQTQINGMA